MLRHAFATISCTTAPTCASCRRCSATPTSPPPRSTPTCSRSGSRAWCATCARWGAFESPAPQAMAGRLDRFSLTITGRHQPPCPGSKPYVSQPSFCSGRVLGRCAGAGADRAGSRLVRGRERRDPRSAHQRLRGGDPRQAARGRQAPRLSAVAAWPTAARTHRPRHPGLHQAIEINPRFASAFSNHGIAYGLKGDYDRAIQDYEQAIKLTPAFAEAFFNRGNAYLGKSQYAQAIDDYNQAIQLKADFAAAFDNRCWARGGPDPAEGAGRLQPGATDAEELSPRWRAAASCFSR